MISVIAGVGFAFIPIENRPMDVWVTSFFKRIYSPTLYSWVPPETDLKLLEKTNKLAILPLFSYPRLFFSRKNSGVALPTKPMLPSTLTLSVQPPQKTMPSVNIATPTNTHTIPSSPNIPTTPNMPTNTQPIVVSQNTTLQPASKTSQEVSNINQNELHSVIAIPQKQIPQTSTPPVQTGAPPTITRTQPLYNAPAPTPPPIIQPSQAKQSEENRKLQDMIIALQNQLSQTASEKNRLEAEKISLIRKLEQTKVASQPVRQAGTTAAPGAPTVQVLSADMSKKQSLKSLVSVPNVVTGIIKDDQGLLLPEIIVTIRDKDDVPLRALKTNKLGQFAASTPLQNNTYFIEIEDTRKRYLFDRIQITLNGTVVPLIEIRAKSQKQIDRQKLAEQIFGKPVQ